MRRNSPLPLVLLGASLGGFHLLLGIDHVREGLTAGRVLQQTRRAALKPAGEEDLNEPAG